jgi:hypothetical protein
MLARLPGQRGLEVLARVFEDVQGDDLAAEEQGEGPVGDHFAGGG